MGNTIRIAGIIENSIVDGPGIRTTIFTQGCYHHCAGCHNPETWAIDGGIEYRLDDLAKSITSSKHVKKLTFSGGEPFLWPAELGLLINILRTKYQKDYHIMVYTGYTFEVLFKQYKTYKALTEKFKPDYEASWVNFFESIDLLVDGKFDQKLKTMDLKFRGSSNQKIYDVKQSIMLDKPILSDLN